MNVRQLPEWSGKWNPETSEYGPSHEHERLASRLTQELWWERFDRGRPNLSLIALWAISLGDEHIQPASLDEASGNEDYRYPRYFSLKWPMDPLTGRPFPQFKLEALNPRELERIFTDLRIFELAWHTVPGEGDLDYPDN